MLVFRDKDDRAMAVNPDLILGVEPVTDHSVNITMVGGWAVVAALTFDDALAAIDRERLAREGGGTSIREAKEAE